MSVKKIYVAIVRRTIKDEVELQLVVNGEMDALEIEKQAEAMAAKLGQFDPAGLGTQIKSSLIFMDLVEQAAPTETGVP